MHVLIPSVKSHFKTFLFSKISVLPSLSAFQFCSFCFNSKLKQSMIQKQVHIVFVLSGTIFSMASLRVYASLCPSLFLGPFLGSFRLCILMVFSFAVQNNQNWLLQITRNTCSNKIKNLMRCQI